MANIFVEGKDRFFADHTPEEIFPVTSWIVKKTNVEEKTKVDPYNALNTQAFVLMTAELEAVSIMLLRLGLSVLNVGINRIKDRIIQTAIAK